MGYRTDAATEFLNTTTQPITDEPLSLAAWFNSESATLQQFILGVITSGTFNHSWWIEANGGLAGDPVRAGSRATASALSATGTGYTTGTWHHAAGTFASNTNRLAYIDGAAGTANTTNQAITAGDQVRVALAGDATLRFAGAIAEPAVWNVELTAAEIAVLARGYSPLFVRPQALVFYAPLVRKILDYKGRAITENGTTEIVAHVPKIIYPSKKVIGVPVAAAAGGRIFKLAGSGGGLGGVSRGLAA